MTFSAVERAALGQLLIDKGPDAPTLCGEWNTHDLAVHLWVRERGLGASVVSLLPGRQDAKTEVVQGAAQRPYEELVRDWASGPPSGLNPWRALDQAVNGFEHFVHHEDVRRGAVSPGEDVEPRSLTASQEKYLYRVLKLSAAVALRSERPVILAPTGFPRIVLKDKPGVTADGAGVVRIDGAVGEMVLWIFGRDVVELAISGDDSSMERMTL